MYGAALKLADLAKGAGEGARIQAAWAVGSTLFWRGRFVDALQWLPASDAGETCRSWALSLLGERVAALALPATAMLHFLLDDPQACLRCIDFPADPIAAAQTQLLRYWAQTRLDQAADEGRAQTALSTLRQLSPCEAARGLAVHAEAAFSRNPAFALPHLDHALDQFARFGLHYLEARLLEHKTAALEAAGQLSDASRFQRAADEVRRRQRRLDGPTG